MKKTNPTPPTPPVPPPRPSLEVGLSAADVRRLHTTFGYNEVIPKKEKFIITLLKKFIGPVEIILELLAVYFFLVAPFLPTSKSIPVPPAPPPSPSPSPSSDAAVAPSALSPSVANTTVSLAAAEGTSSSWINGIIVVLLIITNITLSLIQQRRAAKKLAKLKENLQVTCRVLRDATWSVLPARELVPGDVVRLRHGDFVPADMEIAHGDIDVDQSPLTGESLLVSKSVEESPEVYGGSIVKRGECLAYVTNIGINTFHGKSLQLLQESTPQMHVQTLIANLSYALVAAVVVLLVIGIIVQAIRDYRHLVDMVPILAVLLVSGVPVALPTMFTVTLSLASSVLSKKGVLVTRLDSAEDAARMTILCSDKTGTLTQNLISVVGVWHTKKFTNKDVLFYARLCSKKENEDPIDSALFKVYEETMDDREELYEEFDFIPFDAKIRRTEALHRFKGVRASDTSATEKYRVVRTMKGAVDIVAAFCGMSEGDKKEMLRQVEVYSRDGCRTIAVAKHTRRTSSLQSEKQKRSQQLKGKYEFVGLLALADPPRSDTKEVIAKLNLLGIRVIMLTGDSLIIAKKVAHDVGIGPNIVRFKEFFKRVREATSGSEAEMTTASEGDEVDHADYDISHIDGFAEIFPEDKHLIVTLLQNKGFIVGMTGDGANDAPALKQAEVGIAVSNATDVAKSAASAVLTHEGLSGMVDMIKVGRQVHQKISTWILNKIAKTFMSIGTIMVLYFATGLFIIDATKMILLLFLVDFVTVAIAGDNARPARHPEKWDIIRLVIIGCVIGLVSSGSGIALILIGLNLFGEPPSTLDTPSTAPYGLSAYGLQTFTFSILFFYGMGTLLSVRERHWFFSSSPSWPLLLAIGIDGIIIFLISVLGIPPLNVQPIFYGWVLAAILGAILTALVDDCIKRGIYKIFDYQDKRKAKKLEKLSGVAV